MRTSRSTPEPERAEVGVTLVELLVVLAILGTLLGIGVGVFRGLVAPDRVAASQVQDALFAAQLLAQREHAPATVVVDPDAGRVYARGLRAVGNWHFEDALGTGWPVDAFHEPDDVDPLGALGHGLRLEDGAELTIADLPSSADSAGGFALDVELRPSRAARPMTLLERRGVWKVALDREDRPVVTLHLARDDSDEAEVVPIVVGEPIRWPHRFVRLGVLFDGSTLRVTLDDGLHGEAVRFPAPRRLVVPVGAAPLSTGEGPRRYVGQLDELRLLSVVEAEARDLPGDVALLGERRVLHLDARGRLDPSHHDDAVVIGLVHGDPPLRTDVEFGLWGSIRTREGGPR